MAPGSIPVMVVVFYQHGCPACDEYLPRFKRIAARYDRCVPVLYVDLGKSEHENLIAKFGPRFTPATVVWRPPSWRRPEGVRSWESAMPDSSIEGLFQLAARAAACEV